MFGKQPETQIKGQIPTFKLLTSATSHSRNPLVIFAHHPCLLLFSSVTPLFSQHLLPSACLCVRPVSDFIRTIEYYAIIFFYGKKPMITRNCFFDWFICSLTPLFTQDDQTQILPQVCLFPAIWAFVRPIYEPANTEALDWASYQCLSSRGPVN